VVWSSSFSSVKSISKHPDIIFRRRVWKLGVSAAETTMTGPSVTVFNCSLTCVNKRACPATLLPTHYYMLRIKLPARITALGILLNVSSWICGDLTKSESSFVIFSLNDARISCELATSWINDYLYGTFLHWPESRESFSSQIAGGIGFLSIEEMRKVKWLRWRLSLTAFSFAWNPEWWLNWLVSWYRG
jgi:hypothetical protein